MHFTINPASYIIGAVSAATVGCIVMKKIFDGVFHNKMEEYSKFVYNNMFYFVRNCMYDISDEIHILKLDIRNLIKKENERKNNIKKNVETQTNYELPKLKIDISVISYNIDDDKNAQNDCNYAQNDDEKNDCKLNNCEEDNYIVNGVMPTQFVHSIYDINCDYEHIESEEEIYTLNTK